MVATINKMGYAIRCKFQHLTVRNNCEVETVERENMLKDINKIKLEIKAARSHFDFQTDFELIEADIYHLNELESRYNYLIKESKKLFN